MSNAGFRGFAARVLAVCAFSACGPPAQPPVVLFVIDTLRADRVGVYGYERPTTPRLDALAAEGVVFDHAYAPAPWTLPSVVSLMTSTFPCQHGVVVDGQQLSTALPTLAERMREAGWTTGSLHANAYAGAPSGLDRGFGSSELVPHADGAAVDAWLEAAPPGPFFLYLHNVEPHDAYVAPPSLLRRFGRVASGERDRVNRLLRQLRQLTRVDFDAGRPPGTTDNRQEQRALMVRIRSLAPHLIALYDADVRLADQRLGSVIDALERRGLWAGVLFVVVSDHGEEFGEHGGYQHDQSVYEELVRVPMIMRFPRAEFGGRRVAQVASLVDVLPTLADYLGRPELAEGSRGRSLMPWVRGAEPGADTLVPAMRINRKKHFGPFEELRGDLNVVVRSGSWKGIWNADTDSFELYDLARDARERRNLASEHEVVARALRGEAESWLAACRGLAEASPPLAADSLDAAARERLRALGYAN